MKFKNLYLLLMIFGSFLLSGKTFAQAGNTGSWPPDIELLEKCVDSLDLGTNFISYYETQTHRAGFAITIATYRSNGSTFTPPSGKITLGMCPQSITISKDSLRQIVLFKLCDEGTGTSVPFWRVVQRTYWPTTGAGSFQTIANLDKNGLAYTVTGTVSDEPCMGYELPTVDLQQEITSSVNYNSAANYESWAVTNVGMTIITMTITGGSAVNLYPGETRTCSTMVDWYRNYLRLCGQITVNATSGTAHVYVRSKL